MRRLLAILSILVVLAASCGDSDDATTGDEGTDTSASAETSTTAPASGDGTGSSTTGADGAGEESEEDDEAATAEPVTVTLVSHDSFNVTEELLAGFEADTGITVEILTAGDAGEMLNQLILTEGDPIGDLVWGIDNTLMSKALAEDLFEPYESPLLDEIDDELELDPEHRLLPVDRGDVCLNYDVAFFSGDGPAVPSDLADLTDEAYADLLVVENPATSSPGLAFLLATIAEFGEDGWQDYWQGLVDNGVAVQPGWSEAYYGDFTVAGGGDRPLVVSYASSPPAEVIFADPPVDEAPTGVVERSCFRQIEFTGVLAGTEKADAARQVVDFLLSVELQEDIPLQMFVFPSNVGAELPPEFLEYTTVPDDPLELDADTIDANRERWIEEWNDIVVG